MNLQQAGDPVIFENAAISVDAVRSILEREGRTEEAQRLQGLEVLSPSGAEVALDALRSIRTSPGQVRDAIEWASSACSHAAMSKRFAA